MGTQVQLEGVEILVERGIAKSVGSAYAVVRRGQLPPGVAVRVGGKVRINPALLDRYLLGGGDLATPRPMAIEAGPRVQA